MTKQQKKILTKAMYGQELQNFNPEKDMGDFNLVMEWVKKNEIDFRASLIAGGYLLSSCEYVEELEGIGFAKSFSLSLCRMCVEVIKIDKRKLKTL